MTLVYICWTDPLSLARLAKMAVTLADCRGLLVMTSSADGYPIDQAWRGGAGGCAVMTLDLTTLRKEDFVTLAAFFIDSINQTAVDCIDRAGRNPLFLEQLLRNVEERGAGDVPGSIQSLIPARLDRLTSLN